MIHSQSAEQDMQDALGGKTCIQNVNWETSREEAT